MGAVLMSHTRLGLPKGCIAVRCIKLHQDMQVGLHVKQTLQVECVAKGCSQYTLHLGMKLEYQHATQAQLYKQLCCPCHDLPQDVHITVGPGI